MSSVTYKCLKLQSVSRVVLFTVLIFRILALEKLGAVFNQASTPLTYTPRKFVISQDTNSLVIIETDHNAYTEETTQQRKQQMAEEMVSLFFGT